MQIFADPAANAVSEDGGKKVRAAGPLWLCIALLLMLTIIGFPFGVVMLYKTWKVTTLQRNPTVIVRHTVKQAG